MFLSCSFLLEVSAKLQAILRPNPKRARPSCRKKQTAVVETDALVVKDVKVVKAECLPEIDSRKDREVWEVDSSASDVEAVPLMAARPESGHEAACMQAMMKVAAVRCMPLIPCNLRLCPRTSAASGAGKHTSPAGYKSCHVEGTRSW